MDTAKRENPPLYWLETSERFTGAVIPRCKNIPRIGDPHLFDLTFPPSICSLLTTLVRLLDLNHEPWVISRSRGGQAIWRARGGPNEKRPRQAKRFGPGGTRRSSTGGNRKPSQAQSGLRRRCAKAPPTTTGTQLLKLPPLLCLQLLG